MGQYGQSLDLGKELENEAAREAQAEAAREAERKAEAPVSEKPAEEPVPVVTVAPISEEPKPAEDTQSEESPEEPGAPEEAPRSPDPGEEDVVEILSKHVPHAFVPKEKSYGWILALIGIALLVGLLWFYSAGTAGQEMVVIAPLPAQVPEITPQNVSTEDELARLLAEGLQDARVRSASSV
jgi:hypothetical protein